MRFVSWRRADKAGEPFVFVDGFFDLVVEFFQEFFQPRFVIDQYAREEYRGLGSMFSDYRQDSVDHVFIDVGQNQVIPFAEVYDEIFFGIEEFDGDIVGMVFFDVFNGVVGCPGVVVERKDREVVSEFAGGDGQNAGAGAYVHDFFC